MWTFTMSLALAGAPSIDDPPVSGSRAPKELAVVIANQDYTGFADVAYASRDADAFQGWLTRTRGLPAINVTRLNGATKRKIEDAVAAAAREVPDGGTLWVYYTGHGLGMRVGGQASERVLVGINAVASADEIGDNVVAVSALEKVAAASGAAQTVFVLDSCFNNKDATGAPLVRGSFAIPAGRLNALSGVTVWTAASEDETAQWYEPARHGAFTYFAVGALSGWADGIAGEADGAVTLGEAQQFVGRAMSSAGIFGQTAQVAGDRDLRMASGKLAARPEQGFAAPVVPANPGGASGSFGFDGDLAAQLKAQSCDEEASRTAEKQADARAEAEAAKVRQQATAKWQTLKPQLDDCLRLDEKKACVAAAEKYVAAGKAAKVDVAAGVEVVKTGCGDRSRAVAARSVAVSIREVADAEAYLGRLSGPKPGADARSPTLGTLKWIPAGTFTMGSPAGEAGHQDDEKQHQVTLTKGFHMMEHEVTQGEWQTVMGSNPSHFTSCGASCPVEQVSWDDAQAFIARVSARDGATYRLPTEAEWEYAARGGGSSAYAGSSEINAVAWYSGNSDTKTHPGCQKARNGYGLCDMSGNVWEWVRDWYAAEYPGTTTDPTGAPSGSVRVFRGGGWGNVPALARVANRGGDTPGFRDNLLGFRLVRSVP